MLIIEEAYQAYRKLTGKNVIPIILEGQPSEPSEKKYTKLPMPILQLSEHSWQAQAYNRVTGDYMITEGLQGKIWVSYSRGSR